MKFSKAARSSAAVSAQRPAGTHTPLRAPLLVSIHSETGETLSAVETDQSGNAPQAGISFGVLDAKGELFERTLYLIGRALKQLARPEAERLCERLVIVDLSSPDPVTSYNIAVPVTCCMGCNTKQCTGDRTMCLDPTRLVGLRWGMTDMERLG